MARFRNSTVVQTAPRVVRSVVLGNSAVRYVLDAYIVEPEARASANLKAAASPSELEIDLFQFQVGDSSSGETGDAGDDPAAGDARVRIRHLVAHDRMRHFSVQNAN